MKVVMGIQVDVSLMRHILAFSVTYDDQAMCDYDAASARKLVTLMVERHGTERLSEWATYIDPHHQHMSRVEVDEYADRVWAWARAQTERLRKRGVKL